MGRWGGVGGTGTRRRVRCCCCCRRAAAGGAGTGTRQQLPGLEWHGGMGWGLPRHTCAEHACYPCLGLGAVPACGCSMWL